MSAERERRCRARLKDRRDWLGDSLSAAMVNGVRKGLGLLPLTLEHRVAGWITEAVHKALDRSRGRRVLC